MPPAYTRGRKVGKTEAGVSSTVLAMKNQKVKNEISKGDG